MSPATPFRLRCSAAVIRVASWFVPRAARGEWQRQWRAELAHRWQRRQTHETSGARSVVGWSLGSFIHAWYLFRTEYTMDLLWQDVRFAVRSLRNGPGLVAVAVLSLALGIGANATVFSAVDVFMLRPLPYPDANRLLAVYTTNESRGWNQVDMSVPDFLDYRAQSSTLDVVALDGISYNFTGDDTPERLRGHQVSADFFPVVGVSPLLGRGFGSDDVRVGAPAVVVLSHGFWQRRFGADPQILGRDVSLNTVPHTVVGVMPPRFWFDDPTVDVWTPLALRGDESRNSHYLDTFARIGDGWTVEQARAELEELARNLAAAHPATSDGNGVRVISLRDSIFDEGFRRGSLIASVAVAFVLLIACANVANLLLTRAAGRGREVALRGALGAGRGRIARQFLTEAILISGLGGLLGLVFSVAGIRGLVSLMPPWFPRVDEIALDLRVVVFTTAVTVATGLLFGLAPAVQGSRPNLTDTLKEGGRTGSGPKGGRLRKALVVGEVALALVLLVSSTLLVQGFAKIQLTYPGFDDSDVLSFRVTLSEAEYPDSSSVQQFWRELEASLGAVPGVGEVGSTRILPLDGNTMTYYSVGDEEVTESRRPVVSYRDVTGGYFGAMDIPLARGRVFDDRDVAGAPLTVVVNEAFVERHWPDTDPLGEVIAFSTTSREVVGVVGNTLDDGPRDGAQPMVFLSLHQGSGRSMSWVLETAGEVESLMPAVRSAVAAIDPNLPVYRLLSLRAVVNASRGGDTIMAKIMAVLALIALVLAVGGVYGVMAYSVSQRTQEMGVRVALGATHRNVVSLVVRQGTVLALLGIGVGLGIALVVTRSLSTFLFGVSPFDAVTFGAVTVVLFSAGLAASYLPALRATRVDPVVALRTD